MIAYQIVERNRLLLNQNDLHGVNVVNLSQYKLHVWLDITDGETAASKVRWISKGCTIEMRMRDLLSRW